MLFFLLNNLLNFDPSLFRCITKCVINYNYLFFNCLPRFFSLLSLRASSLNRQVVTHTDDHCSADLHTRAAVADTQVVVDTQAVDTQAVDTQAADTQAEVMKH